MRKQMQLHIPEPCHENWSNMTPVEKGRFCGACQKQVIDFTGMNDQQLVAFFKGKKTGSVCGRFVQDQLHRSMEIPGKKIPWVKYFVQFVLPAFFMSTKVHAQGEVSVLKGDTVMVPVQGIDTAKKNIIPGPTENEKIIRGKVVDEKDRGIPYASVLLKGTTKVVTTDRAGLFSLTHNGEEDSCVLSSSCIGFDEVETQVNLGSRQEPLVIPLLSIETSEVMIMAGMVALKIDEPPATDEADEEDLEQKPVTDTIWNKLFSPAISSRVYPNPLKQNSMLTIEMGKGEKGSYLFQLSAMTGQLMLNKELWIDENNRLVQLPVPSLPAGTYLLTMINKKSGKHRTEKIIIQ